MTKRICTVTITDTQGMPKDKYDKWLKEFEIKNNQRARYLTRLLIPGKSEDPAYKDATYYPKD